MTEMAVEQLLADHRECHSDFQIDHFILGKSGGTTYGMYNQCLRELDARHETLLGLDHDLAAQREDIEHLGTAVTGAMQRDLRQRQRRLDRTSDSRANTQREYDRFLMHARAMKADLGELAPKKRESLEWELWLYRLKVMAALDFYTTGNLSRATAETIFAVPPEMRRKILTELKDREAVLAWLETAEAPRLPGATGDNGQELAKAACPAKIARTAGPSVT